MQFWNHLKNDFLLGGLTETEYRRVLGYVLESNHDNWKKISIWGAIFFAVAAISTWLYPSVENNFLTYIVLTVLFGGSAVLFKTVVTPHSFWLMPMVFVLNGILMLLGIMIGVVNNPDNLAVSFMVMLVAVPLVTVGKPYKMDVLLTIEVLIFCVLCHMNETGSIRDIDLYNCIAFWGIALVSNHLITSYRLKSLLWRSEIERESFTDALTRVKNRSAFIKLRADTDEMLGKEACEEFGMIVFDVNHLKKVNDEAGHEAGDQYLQNNCQKICKVFSHSPVYRTGGDEFFVFLKGQDLENHEALLEEIVAANRMDKANTPLSEQVDLAYGLALYDPKKDHSFSDLYRRADEHMYEIKKTMHGERE